jgi:spermidine synthase/Flp pilus assembly protein TadD
MIGPVATKRALEIGRTAGRTLGSVYAWGVVGSIMGTFFAGFMLIAWLGTTAVIMTVSVVLAAIAISYRVRSWKPWAWMGVLILIVTLSTGSAEAIRIAGERLALRKPIDGSVLYSTESQYSSIRVSTVAGDPNRREMFLDALLHSQIDMEHPLDLHYQFSKIFAAVTRRLNPEPARVDSLTIGGGGYVYPRYMNSTYPGSRTDVVEIDPEVTRAAIEAFGLPMDTPIRSFHEDARVVVDRLRQQKERGGSDDLYDVIYVDAFNHHSVPFQLTTLEFVESVAEILEPRGSYLVHLIDTFDHSLFLGAVVNTVGEVFPYVNIFVEGVPVHALPEDRNSFVVVATRHPLDVSDLDKECTFDCQIFALTEAEKTRVSEKSHQVVLTDDYAPVENLLAAIVERHSLDRAFGEWKLSIQSAMRDEDYDRAVAIGRKALAAFADTSALPVDHANLMAEAGSAMLAKGLVGEARKVLRRALDIHPSNARARLALIDCYRNLDMLEESLPLFDGLLDYDPLVRYNYATTLAQLGRYEEAAMQFRTLTQITPTFALGLNNYGNVLRLMGDLEGAAEQFKRALESDPNFTDARNNLTLVLASLEEASGAKPRPDGESSQ